MNNKEVLEEFYQAGALLEGHFLLSSGLHSRQYLQCAKVLMDAKRSEKLAKALIEKLGSELTGKIDMVVSPAMGGLIIGYEIGRQLGVPSIFFERNSNGNFSLRRGFEIEKGAICLMVEDIVTTGLSSCEVIEAIKAAGGEVISAACLIDRSEGTASLPIPLTALAEMRLETFSPDNLPEDLEKIPVIKPGSRNEIKA
ncbi:MAG: orotate phosphoribosyltransferase [Parvibaculales bacterium]